MDSDDDFSEQDLCQKDWSKSEKNMKTDGFRVGMEENHEDTLQRGFNAAFKVAIEMAMEAGKLHGNLCARMSCKPLQDTSIPQAGSPSALPSSDSMTEQSDQNNGTEESLQHSLDATLELISNIPKFLDDSLSNTTDPGTVHGTCCYENNDDSDSVRENLSELTESGPSADVSCDGSVRTDCCACDTSTSMSESDLKSCKIFWKQLKDLNDVLSSEFDHSSVVESL